jgi:hypothetical protein
MMFLSSSARTIIRSNLNQFARCWQYDGAIYLHRGGEADDDIPTRIGTVLVYRLLPAVAHDAGVSLRDALDYISGDTAQYIALLDD